MGATLPRHIEHSKAKRQGARRPRALCPRSEAIDTFLPFGCGVPVANAPVMPRLLFGPIRVREHDVDAGLIDEIGRFLGALETAVQRRGGDAQKLGQLRDAAGSLAGLVQDMAHAVSNPRAGQSAARFDHAYARPCTARFFGLPVAAAERRDDALTAKEGPVDHGKPGERALTLADRAVLLEQAQNAVGTFESREAVSFKLPAVAQAESDRIGGGLAFELRAAQHKGLRAHLTRSSFNRGGEREAHHTPRMQDSGVSWKPVRAYKTVGWCAASTVMLAPLRSSPRSEAAKSTMSASSSGCGIRPSGRFFVARLSASSSLMPWRFASAFMPSATRPVSVRPGLRPTTRTPLLA